MKGAAGKIMREMMRKITMCRKRAKDSSPAMGPCVTLKVRVGSKKGRPNGGGEKGNRTALPELKLFYNRGRKGSAVTRTSIGSKKVASTSEHEGLFTKDQEHATNMAGDALNEVTLNSW